MGKGRDAFPAPAELLEGSRLILPGRKACKSRIRLDRALGGQDEDLSQRVANTSFIYLLPLSPLEELGGNAVLRMPPSLVRVSPSLVGAPLDMCQPLYLH